MVLFIFTSIALAEGEWVTSGENIFSTNSGKVGIGTTSPGAKLNVRGDYPIAKFDSSSIYGANILLFSDHDSTDKHWRINAGGQDAINRKDKLNFVAANDNGSWRKSIMTLQQDGNVGIGTTSPITRLHITESAGGLADLLLLESNVSNYDKYSLRFNNSSGLTVFDYDDQRDELTFRGNGDIYMTHNAGNVGIGTNTMDAKLHVRGDYPIAKFDSRSIYGASILLFNDYDSTDRHWRINAGGQDAVHRKDKLNFVTANDQGSWFTTVMTLQQDGNIGIGTTSPQSKLAVNGNISAKEVKVTETGWSDFVFDDAYELPLLSSVESYIKEHKHLPGIPSAKNVKEKGLVMSEMLAKQMQKIEEMTLYLINIQKENDHLKAKNAELERRLATLEAGR